jgi:hypothetical protein
MDLNKLMKPEFTDRSRQIVDKTPRSDTDRKIPVERCADSKKWMIEAVRSAHRVGVVDADGLLVNVGRFYVAEDDPDRLLFYCDLITGAPVDVRLDDPSEVDDYGYKFVPMTSERELRWSKVVACRNIIWNIQRTDDLVRVLEILNLKVPA